VDKNKILVLKNESKTDLTQKLLDLGYEPIPYDDSERVVVARISTRDYLAAMIDLENYKGDIVHFVLEARTADQDMPIIIYGRPDNERESMALYNREKVYFIESGISKTRLDIELKRVLQESLLNNKKHNQ